MAVFKNHNTTLKIIGSLVVVAMLASLVSFFYLNKLPSPLLSDPLTQEERAWLTAHNGKIRLAPSPNSAPMEVLDATGKYSGMVADFIKEIEKNLGFSFKLVHADNWAEVVEMAEKQEVDIISAAKPTPERNKYMLWTEPYLDIPNVIVTRKTEQDELTLSQLAGREVGVRGSYVVADYVAEHYPQIILHRFKNDLDGIRKVAFEELDATIVEFPHASHIITKERITNLKVAGEAGYVAPQCIGIRKDWPILFSIMKKGLAQITPEKKKEILGQWTYLIDYPFYYSKTFWTTVILISTGVACIAGLVFVWNITLRYKVNLKTAELTKELTKRQKITEELEESRQRLSNLIRNLPGMAYLYHHKQLSENQWPDEFISHGCSKLTGYSSLELQGKTRSQFFQDEIYHPDVRVQLQEELKRLISQKGPFRFTYPIITANGQKKWVLEQGVATHTENGEVAFVEGFVIDITELKNTEESLSRSKKLFQDLVNNSPIGISIIQRQKVVFQNPEQKRCFGQLPEEHDFIDVSGIVPDDIATARAFLESITEGNSNIDGPDLRLHKNQIGSPEPEIIWARCKASRITYKGLKSILLIMIDITHAKELERIVSMKNKMASLGHVAAGIAHEIRNPLSGINIYLSGIQRNSALYNNHSDITKNIELIREASNDIEIVIKRVLDFAKPGVPMISSIDVNTLVDKALHLCAVFFKKNNIKVEKDIAREELVCRVDSNMIQRVILNVLTNAAEAMKPISEEKIIRIRTYRDIDFIVVSISDSGPGIPQMTEGNSVFDPFYTTKNDGTGIGLSLSHRIIEDHFGEITVSTGELGGAEFIIKLPIQEGMKI